MLKKIQSRNWIFVVFATLVIFIALTFVNFKFAEANPGGTDFLVHWVGTQSFLSTGDSPYSDKTALAIQTLVYGHAAQAGEHELRVAYPLYSIILFAPFALVKNFTIARSLWMTVLELSLLGIAFFSIRLAFWKIKPWLMGVFLLFMLLSYNGARPLINGNAVIVVTLFIVIALLCIRDGKDEIAGLLLAFSTIKPQNVILLIAFIFFWALINHRTRIITWFFGTMVILVGFSILLIPDWIVQNLREIIRYPSYNPPGSPGAAMTVWWGSIGQRFSIALTVLLSILLLYEWWSGRKAGMKRFLWVSMFTLAISQWIGIQTDPGNFILLYPAIFFAFEMIASRWKKNAIQFILIFLIVETVGVWAIFLLTLHKTYQPVQSSVMFFPLPILVFGLLYWVRWWVIHSSQIDYSEKPIGL